MKRASEILFKISTILGAIIGGVVLAFVPFELIVGFSGHIREMLIEAFDNGTITYTGDISQMNGELFATIIQTTLVVSGIISILVGVGCVIGAILGVRARKEATRGLLIASIVVGALSLDSLVVAGIFGLIVLNKEAKRE